MTGVRNSRRFRIERTRAGSSGSAVQTPAPSADLGELKTLIESLRHDVQALTGKPTEPSGVDPSTFREQVLEAERLKGDLQELSEAIDRTKQEIATLRRTDSESDKLATASEALRAVVGDTESATDGIINAAEALEDLAGRLRAQVSGDEAGGMVDEIYDYVTKIFEHCNFQDITGQRITKVVNTMEFIDDRVHKMMDIWGGHQAFEGVTGDEAPETPTGEVLHGPAMEGDGSISQSEIDALFD